MTTEMIKMHGGKQVAVSFWDNTDTPKAAVVVVHGMCEYIARYNEFCTYLGTRGYNVVGMDDRGFGDTDPDARGKGYAGMFEATVDDIHREVELARQRWGVERVYVIGHSYGSFLTQRFIERYGSDVSGAILCGSALQSGIMLKVGRWLAGRKAKKAPDSPGESFAKITFVSYDKKLGCTTNGWINRDEQAVASYNADDKCAGVGICSNMFYKEMFEGIASANRDRGSVPKALPLMIVSGTDDGVGGFGKLVKKLHKAYKKCGVTPVLKLYDGGRHEILNELNKAEVYKDFADFLDSCQSKSDANV